MALPASKRTWVDNIGELFKYGFRLLLLLLAVAAVVGSLQQFFQLSAGTHAHTVKPCVAAIDMEALDKYRAAYKINDTFGISELISHERILPLGPHTSVLVLESAINWSGFSDSVLRRRVRILEGDYQGKAGWLADDFMVADAPPAT